MKDPDFKKRLVVFCISHQTAVYQTTLQAIRDAEQEAADYGAPKDRYDGFRNQQARKREMLGKQLALTENNLRVLAQPFLKQAQQQAMPGALVVTDQRIFFIAAGLGVVGFEGGEVAVISAQVPVFAAMRGKKTGEVFSFGGVSHTILQII